jgi:hypothetical protein
VPSLSCIGEEVRWQPLSGVPIHRRATTHPRFFLVRTTRIAHSSSRRSLLFKLKSILDSFTVCHMNSSPRQFGASIENFQVVMICEEAVSLFAGRLADYAELHHMLQCFCHSGGGKRKLFG